MSNTFDNNNTQQICENFARTYPYEFSLNKARDFLIKHGCNLELDEVYDYVSLHPTIFKISGGLYITRAAFFTEKKFSIKPQAEEIKLGILIPGHRTMPFTDPEYIGSDLEFFIDDEIVPKKTVTLNRKNVFSAYDLYGQEYIPQFLSYDKAHVEKKGDDYEIDNFNEITITVLDLQKWYEKWSFNIKDRLVVYVVDWNLGHLALEVDKNTQPNSFEITEIDQLRQQWYDTFEKHLLKMINIYGGCSSIEEQLAYTYFISKGALFKPCCGTTEEFLQRKSKVKIDFYGVETRFTPVDGCIPVLGNWNNILNEQEGVRNTLFYHTGLPVPDFILDAYVLDFLYKKEKKLSRIVTRLAPMQKDLDNWQSKLLFFHIATRHKVYCAGYNYFLDFEIGAVRHELLQLYTDLLSFFNELVSTNIPLFDFPKTEIVVLKQLFSHTSSLIEALLFQKNIRKKDLKTALMSVEGMRFSYEEIKSVFLFFIKTYRKDTFSLFRIEEE
ncbi:MAG TPA: hypothetical protein VFC68_04810 [Treponemataceae bacterium]|nr:hypothetical protein [Treponemataceae bacterium]